MGTKANPGAFDCYANAKPDEPLFVLLARDKHAPALIWLWAALRELEQEKPAKVAEARDCVTQMILWQNANGIRPVGVGHAALAGTMELIRAANAGLAAMRKTPEGEHTTDEQMRLFLSAVYFSDPDSAPE